MSVAASHVTDDTLDRMDLKRSAEFDRWYVRYVDHPDGRRRYCIVRSGRDDNSEDEVIKLTKREVTHSVLPPRDMATSWLNTYRSRAAMRAALEAL